MYNFEYVSVTFPMATSSPKYIYSIDLTQNRYEHETAKIIFKDWDLDYDAITTNSPISIKLTGSNEYVTFNGYVDYVKPCITPGENYTEVGFISASGNMRNQIETVYKNITADQVVKRIANKYGFACYSVPHPRIYPQISQAGRSDWQLMVRLAKQNGYTLRTHNTELYFQPVLEDYTKYRAQAKYFSLQYPESTIGTTIYSFDPIIGEAIDYKESFKAAVAVAGVDKYSKSAIKTAKQNRNKKTRKKKKPESFDRFATDIVVNDPETAKYEAEAAENRNVFPYRAWVEVLGEPSLRPDMPVYLDNVGKAYSGYWTILGTEHRVIEEEINQYRYTTMLYVGTDSLGLSDVWVDNSLVPSPDAVTTRVVVPNVRQTQRVSTSTLLVKTPMLTPQAVSDSGLVSNRPPAQEVSARTPVWKSTTSSLNSITTEPRKSPAVIARLQKSGLL